MPTCISSINENNNITEIDIRTVYDIQIDLSNNKLFYINMQISQTLYMILKFNKTISNSFFYVSVIEKTKLSTVMTFKISDSTKLDILLDSGEYYICLRSVNLPYSINVQFDMLKYIRMTNFIINSYSGESSNLEKINLPKNAVDCNQPLKYSLIEGELPTGLTIDSKGRISGILPLIDTENKRNFPSFNLYNENFAYSAPIEVRYDFTLKVELEHDPSKFEIRKFCINVVNDWDLSLHEYLDDYENEITGTVHVLEDERLKSLCSPCEITKPLSDTIWYYNEYGSVTRDNFESRAKFIKKINILDDVISRYNIDKQFNDKENYQISNQDSDIIDIGNDFKIDYSESILIPEGIDVLKFIEMNIKELIADGYNEYLLNKYINEESKYVIEYFSGLKHLTIFSDFEDKDKKDVQNEYQNNRLEIMSEEPIYSISDFGNTMIVEIAYENKRYNQS